MTRNLAFDYISTIVSLAWSNLLFANVALTDETHNLPVPEAMDAELLGGQGKTDESTLQFKSLCPQSCAAPLVSILSLQIIVGALLAVP